MTDPNLATLLKPLREKDDLQNGRFFRMGEDWGVDFQKFEESQWAALQRNYPDHDTKPIKVFVRRKDGNGNRSDVDPYGATLGRIDSDNDGPLKASFTRSKSDDSADAKKQMWPIDVSGEGVHNPKMQKVARLLPAVPKEHEEWVGVASAALGIPTDESTKKKLMATREVKRKKDEGSESAGREEADVDAKPEVAASCRSFRG